MASASVAVAVSSLLLGPAGVAGASTSHSRHTKTPAPPPSSSSAALLAGALSNLGASAHFGVKDDQGISMDTLKVLQVGTTYLGVYQDCATTCQSRLATSTDLVHWAFRVILDPAASQPYLAADSTGGYVLAVEAAINNHVRLWHYANLDALLAGAADEHFDAARTLSSCAEGTPSITSVTPTTISLGLHYFAGCSTDREASATLTGWSWWNASSSPAVDAAMVAAGAAGKHGDRDTVTYGGQRLTVLEGQQTLNDWTSWRFYVYDPSTGAAVQAAVRSAAGTVDFANPALTSLTSPIGAPVVFVTAFVPSEGVVYPDRAGELTYTVPAA